MNQCPICGYVNQTQARYCQSCGRLLPGSQTISLGGLVQNRYQVIKLLGQGGMGAVYLVADQRIGGKQLAMKEMSDAAITDPVEKAETIRAFQQEATLLAQLDHPNIPKVSDFFSENGKHYIVMEFVPGETLEELQKRRGGVFSEAEVVEWGRQLCDVLMYLHSRVPPIIFRDLKPGNIMITSDGKVKLIDFGIARHFTSGKSSDTIIMGTQGFAPPEQYGKRQTDARSDIYSLGVVLYFLLTRYDPAAAAFRLPPARQINPAISPAMGAVVGRATQMNPDLRYQSAADMLAALPVRAVAAASVAAYANPMLPPTQVVTPQFVQPAGQAAGGRRGVPVFVVVLLIVALIGLGAIAVTTLAARERPTPAPAPAPTQAPAAVDTPAPAPPAQDNGGIANAPSATPNDGQGQEQGGNIAPSVEPATDTPQPPSEPPTDTPEPPTDTPVSPTDTPTADWRLTEEPLVREIATRYGDIKVEAFTYLNDRFAELLVDPVLERQRRGVCWLRNQKFYYDYSDRFAEILSVNFQGQDRATVISHIKEKRVLRHQGTNKVAKDYGPEDYRAIYELARQQDGRWYIYCLQALADDVPAEGPFECKIETDPNAVNPCTQPQN